METLDIGDYIALVTNIAALILSIFAIWLSIVFFKMSSALSESTKEAAKGIGASVDRLEKLFDKLYADTFSMMRDTVSDMRRHIWPEDTSTAAEIAEETESKVEERLAALREDMERELSQVLSRQMQQDERTDSIRQLLDRAIASTREVASEAEEETVRETILRALEGRHKVHLFELTSELPVPPSRLFIELRQLKDEGLVHWDDDDFPSPKSIILINPRLFRRSARDSEIK